jgi:hypothetical protein
MGNEIPFGRHGGRTRRTRGTDCTNKETEFSFFAHTEGTTVTRASEENGAQEDAI